MNWTAVIFWAAITMNLLMAIHQWRKAQQLDRLITVWFGLCMGAFPPRHRPSLLRRIDMEVAARRIR